MSRGWHGREIEKQAKPRHVHCGPAGLPSSPTPTTLGRGLWTRPGTGMGADLLAGVYPPLFLASISLGVCCSQRLSPAFIPSSPFKDHQGNLGQLNTRSQGKCGILPSPSSPRHWPCLLTLSTCSSRLHRRIPEEV